MDALDGFLNGPRARSAFLIRSMFEPPWCLRIEDRAPLTLIAVVSGHAVLTPDGQSSDHLGPGDLAIVGGTNNYEVSDSASTSPTVIIHPGQHCSTPTGEPLFDQMGLGIRTWGNDPTGRDVLLTGTYQHEGEISRNLLDALPPVIVIRKAEWHTPLLELLADEIHNNPPGQQAVLDRLLDLLLIASLRHWATRSDTSEPRWYRAHGDPYVGRGLKLMHDQPADDWTLVTLARASGLSRAAFARRFTSLVGEAPMTYLSNWRMALAADMLTQGNATVAETTRRVGYNSPFTFSTAFKRHHGTSPREHRDRSRREVSYG